jgi:hypothetical protein
MRDVMMADTHDNRKCEECNKAGAALMEGAKRKLIPVNSYQGRKTHG